MSQQNTTNPDMTMEDEAAALAVLREKLGDAFIPGYRAEFAPDEAEQAGTFAEDALSEKDAAESDIDLMDVIAPRPATTRRSGHEPDHEVVH